MQTANEQAKQNGGPCKCKERHNVQLSKTLTSISPVIQLTDNRYIKCKQNIQD